jgi:hypothetical protein
LAAGAKIGKIRSFLSQYSEIIKFPSAFCLFCNDPWRHFYGLDYLAAKVVRFFHGLYQSGAVADDGTSEKHI